MVPPHASWRLLLPSRPPRCIVGAAVPAQSCGGTTPPSRRGRSRSRRGMPGAVVPARRVPSPCGAHGNPVRAGAALSRAAAAIPRAAPAARAPAPPLRAAPHRPCRPRHADLREDPHGENHHPRGEAPPVRAGAPGCGDAPGGRARAVWGIAALPCPARAGPSTPWGPQWPRRHRAGAGSSTWICGLPGLKKKLCSAF